MDKEFKALADPTRRSILTLLKKKDMSVTQLLKNFDMTQASLSHHLDILKRAELVISQRKGQFIFYSLNVSVFESVIKNILNLFDK